MDKKPQEESTSKNPVGRPPTFKTPEELAEKAIEYFEQFSMEGKTDEQKVDIRANGMHPTITGLVLYLGFCDRRSFYEYEEKPEFTHTIRYLRTMIANVYENNLFGANTTGIVFALKNLGWKDRSEVDNTHSFNKIPSIIINGKEMEKI